MSGPLQRNIPLAGDLLSKSQGDLLNNSKYWVDSLGKDHQIVNGHNSGLFEGGHLQVSLLDQTNTNFPIQVTGADIQLWSTAGALYWRNTSVSTGVQMTRNFVPLNAANGFTFIPGGLILQWGEVVLGGGTNPKGKVLYATANMNFPNAAWQVLLTLYSAAGNNSSNNSIALNGAFDNTQFNWQVNQNSGGDFQSFSWIAIGW